ncbi:MAG: lipoyl(octanoyl) transferase LipB [Chitinophagales bacterium]|jgi:lipoyl(octanoyl) transferase|nr:lipoyl(octanoyl) transferase LipB [Chitinophagales bacterium]
MKQVVQFQDLGKMEYRQAWDLQEKLLKQTLANKAVGQPTSHHLLLVEHPPVYTLGKSGKMEHVLIDQQEMQKRQIGFYHSNRGGDITYHGPGQIVGYPIFDLECFYTDIGRYLRELEEVIILTLADYGLVGQRSKGETGVWLDPESPLQARKICAMGVRCSRWVTMHGFALNVHPDLSYFDNIVPCGIANKSVTSMQRETALAIDMEQVKQKLLHHFEAVFDISIAASANVG